MGVGSVLRFPAALSQSRGEIFTPLEVSGASQCDSGSGGRFDQSWWTLQPPRLILSCSSQIRSPSPVYSITRTRGGRAVTLQRPYEVSISHRVDPSLRAPIPSGWASIIFCASNGSTRNSSSAYHCQAPHPTIPLLQPSSRLIPITPAMNGS